MYRKLPLKNNGPPKKGYIFCIKQLKLSQLVTTKTCIPKQKIGIKIYKVSCLRSNYSFLFELARRITH